MEPGGGVDVPRLVRYYGRSDRDVGTSLILLGLSRPRRYASSWDSPTAARLFEWAERRRPGDSRRWFAVEPPAADGPLVWHNVLEPGAGLRLSTVQEDAVTAEVLRLARRVLVLGLAPFAASQELRLHDMWAAPSGYVRSAVSGLRGCAFDYLVIPHPSGRNRHYNEPQARSRAGAALRWLLTGDPLNGGLERTNHG